jgi:Pyruvate/2-oxoacid:ferredoxin oxidoreductase delta subunit
MEKLTHETAKQALKQAGKQTKTGYKCPVICWLFCKNQAIRTQKAPIDGLWSVRNRIN